MSHVNDPLSAEDAVFFYLDTKDMPLHIACVLVFDGPIPVDDCVKLIQSRLGLIPRYRQRVVEPPFNVGHPSWEWDAGFDIHNHVRGITLKRHTEKEFQTLVGGILSEMMDRNKPLWDMTIVDGLKGGRGAIVMRVHHCLVDGVGGVGLLNVFFDPSLVAPDHKQPKASVPSDPGSSLLTGVLGAYSELVERFVSAQSAVLNIAEELSLRGVTAADELLTLVPELLGSVDRLPFNKPCLGPRTLVWTEVPISAVKAIRESLGGKLNDVVLTVVTSAMRRYTQLHHQPVKGRLLRVMVPVSIRPRGGIQGGPQKELGNRVSMFPLIVPLDISSPAKLLKAVCDRMDLLKRSGVSEVIRLAGNSIGFIPAPVQALLGPYAAGSSSLVPIPPWNMVCTNVPGPPSTIHALGRKMIASYPYVPVGAEMGLNIAIQSYDGKLFFGIAGSDVAAPDVSLVPHLIDEAFAELRKAALHAKNHTPGVEKSQAAKNMEVLTPM